MIMIILYLEMYVILHIYIYIYIYLQLFEIIKKHSQAKMIYKYSDIIMPSER